MAIFSNRISIKHHIVGHYAVTLAIILALSGATIYSFVYKNVRRNMMEKLSFATASIKNVVENAANLSVRNHLQSIARMNIDILGGLERQVRNGQISKTEAMKRGEDILLEQRIGDNGYIYALSSKGVLRVHPINELKNRDVSSFNFIQQQIASKNGYLEYVLEEPRRDARTLQILAHGLF